MQLSTSGWTQLAHVKNHWKTTEKDGQKDIYLKLSAFNTPKWTIAGPQQLSSKKEKLLTLLKYGAHFWISKKWLFSDKNMLTAIFGLKFYLI